MKENQIPSTFVVVWNSKKELEYFRDRPLNQKQQDDIIATDKKLDLGFHIAGQHIPKPSDQDKAVFMANQLVIALDKNDEASIAIACTFLATKYTYLQQLKITTHEDRISIELINDKEYTEQTPIQFVSKKDLCS